MPTKDYKTVEFAGENGTTVIGKKDMARTMTIAGTIRGDATVLQNAYEVLYNDGELFCSFGNIRRKIACRCTTLDDFVKFGKSNLNSFAMQFVADYPYFLDFYDTTVAIYELKNMVTETFTLPCIFTKRISEANINNLGHKYVYPKLVIENLGTAASTGCVIENKTTGAKITINNSIVNGEIITVDLATRRINSSVSGNITNKISDDTDLSKFYLEKGQNHLKFSNLNDNNIINAKAIYNNEYLTAVM